MFQKWVESRILLNQEKANLYKQQRMQILKDEYKQHSYLNLGYAIVKTLDANHSIQKMMDEVCMVGLYNCSISKRYLYRFDVRLNNLYSFRVNFANTMASEYGITTTFSIKQIGDMLVIEW